MNVIYVYVYWCRILEQNPFHNQLSLPIYCNTKWIFHIFIKHDNDKRNLIFNYIYKVMLMHVGAMIPVSLSVIRLVKLTYSYKIWDFTDFAFFK